MSPSLFAELAAKLGIDLDAPVEPVVYDGLVVGPCRNGDAEDRCPGRLRLVERQFPICTVHCDTCDFEGGLPAREIDPEITRQRRMEQAEIPRRFFGVRFVEDEENRAALETVRSWLAGADENPVGRAGSLLPAPALYGQAGRGKSHLLAAVAARLVRDLDLGVLFRSARGLLRELQNFEDHRERDRALRRAATVDVLCLDDLGAQRETDWRREELADLVDMRYERELPVVFTSNFPPGMWGEVVDERTLSRLRAMSFAVELRGPDRRVAGQREEAA